MTTCREIAGKYLDYRKGVFVQLLTYFFHAVSPRHVSSTQARSLLPPARPLASRKRTRLIFDPPSLLFRRCGGPHLRSTVWFISFPTSPTTAWDSEWIQIQRHTSSILNSTLRHLLLNSLGRVSLQNSIYYDSTCFLYLLAGNTGAKGRI